MTQWSSEASEKSTVLMSDGHDYVSLTEVGWLHVVSDVWIGIAYSCIALTLAFFLRRFRLPGSPILLLFSLFIALYGLTHFIAAWAAWTSSSGLWGGSKAVAAVVAVGAAVALLMARPLLEAASQTSAFLEQRRVQLESTNAELGALYDKMKELDELKTQFFANISHELRTPLALVLGPTESLLADTNLSVEQKRKLESIRRNGKSLLKQVNDLLDVAKLEEGKMKIRLAYVDLVPLFRRIASQFEIAAEQRHILYRVSTPQTLPAEVDQGMLERVFINLLSNAFKFTPPYGNICAELSLDTDGFCLKISDTGPGVDVHQHQAIFERFCQLDGGGTRRYGGTGLGLAIAKDFVGLHGGRISVASAPGEGAEFTVRLPVRAQTAPVVKEAPYPLDAVTQVALAKALDDLRSSNAGRINFPKSTLPHRPTILVIEDTPEMSDLIVSVLGNEYNIERAFDGQEGLRIALSLEPDLIIADVMMPRMGGDQLLVELRARPRFDIVPMLLLTAKADDELRVKLLNNGAQDYLTKPFMPQELTARVHNLIVVKRASDALRRELASASSDIETLARELAVRHNQLQVSFDDAEVAREQAEHASQVKGRFLAMISHELRTPLSTIIMNAQLLSRQMEGLGTESMKIRLERMIRATQQLSSLVEGVLQYSRVESGKLAARMEAVDTVALAKEVIDVAQLQVSSPKVTLSLESPQEDLPTFVTDPRLLKVVLNNLISNALKFTRTGSVTLRLGRSGKRFTFHVCDTGIGIPAEDIGRIFLPFEQLEPIQRKSTPGVGLGLALTKEIIEALGGRVEVTSEEGAGSTFIVSLPEKYAQQHVPVAKPHSAHQVWVSCQSG